MKVNESGRSMIEMLGVLAIVGVLSVGGIAGYSKAMGKYKTNNVVEQVSMIVTNIRTLYAQQMDYTGLNNLTAVNMGVIPEELINKNASTITNGLYSAVSLRNGFQGNVFVGAASSRSAETGENPIGSNTAFQVEFQGLSRDACVSIASSDWGSGTASGFIGMAIKGDVQTAATATASTNIASLSIGCTGGTADNVTTACPGANSTHTVGETAVADIRVPMPVTQASVACACATENKCSVVWKYY